MSDSFVYRKVCGHQTDPTVEFLPPLGVQDREREYGRVRDVERIFGIKRGTTYNLLASGKIKGALLPVSGNKSGVRLIYLPSVRNYILAQMGQESGQQNSTAE